MSTYFMKQKWQALSERYIGEFLPAAVKKYTRKILQSTYNAGETHMSWKNEEALIDGVTSASSDVAEEVGGEVIPHYNPDKEPSAAGSGISNAGGIEKCTFCDHRVLKGALPYCVEACPTKARTFGDLATPYSEVSKLLEKHESWRDKEDLGTEPKVYYIRKYNKKS